MKWTFLICGFSIAIIVIIIEWKQACGRLAWIGIDINMKTATTNTSDSH